MRNNAQCCILGEEKVCTHNDVRGPFIRFTGLSGYSIKYPFILLFELLGFMKVNLNTII